MVLYKVIIIWLINGCYWTYEANDDYLKKNLMWTYFCIRGDLFMLLVTLGLSHISFLSYSKF